MAELLDKLTRMNERRPLNHNQLRFVANYVTTSPRNARKAYLQTYPTATIDSAGAAAYKLLRDDRVRDEIRRWDEQAQAALELKAEDIHRELYLLASADPRELSEYYIGACRYCWGHNHRYQRTPAEYERDLAEYVLKRQIEKRPDPLGVEFDLQGGIGFNPHKEPNPDCPECFGDGLGYEVFKDTRTLSPGAARLFAGVKRTRDGLEIKTRSQDKAIELAGQAAGMFKRVNEISGPGGTPLVPTAANLTDEQLAAIVAAGQTGQS